MEYDELKARYRADWPATYNMATDSVLRQASGSNADRVALICESEAGAVDSYSYADLERDSAKLSRYFLELGVGKGDIIASFLGQGVDSALTFLAAFRIGAVIAPLSQLYGPEATRHILSDARPQMLITSAKLWDRLAEAGVTFRDVGNVVVSGDARPGTVPFDAYQDRLPISAPADTRAEDPALLLYTSGSTGMPKGILHAHRVLRGYLASVTLFYELQMDDPEQVLWTPSDWSWVAGIFNVMLTGWYFGQTVLANPARFTRDGAFDLMQRHGVTHCFLTPTALKRMAQIEDPKSRWPDLTIRAIGTGGEPLPGAVLDWADRTLNVPINEFYGLTEVNHLVGNCRALYPIRPGSMGRAYPGHVVSVIDDEGCELPDGEVGEIAVRDDDPTLFLGYLNQPQRTRDMRAGRYVRTGDFGHRDADEYFWYEGRRDDLIKSAGYRIGPAEVEDCLVAHEAVAEAAVIGKPDPDRGQIVKAVIRLTEGATARPELGVELQAWVKTRLAAYKYPREIEFVDAFPLTSTGKINRKRLRLEAAS